MYHSEILKEVLQKKNLLSIYYTAGFPELDDTGNILMMLQEGGVDLVEIGFPFSDPVADGPLIQKSSHQAITNGMTIGKLFNQLELTNGRVKIPIILMGYLNPLIQFGVTKFCERCTETGASGVIIPDLPVSEYLQEYVEIFQKHHLSMIFLITPTTPTERIRYIDDNSTSFIYAVSDSSITGVKEDLSDQQLQYLKRLSEMNLAHPILTGFGISNARTFRKVCQFVSGAIIGSAFIQQLFENTHTENISNFIKEIRSHDNKIA